MRDDEKEIEVSAEADSVVEDVDIDELEGDLKAKLKELQKKLKASEKEKLEYLTGWQRTKADFVNATRRAEEERAHVHKYASEGVIEDLIPVLDSFESALSSKDTGQWRDGFARIHTQLLSVLKSRGLELVDQLHVPMDPRMHEAIQMSPSVPEHPPNTIVGILQKGYKLHDKVLRPAKVIVTE